MASFLPSHPSLLSRNPNPPARLFSLPPKTLSLSSLSTISKPLKHSSFRLYSSLSDEETNPIPITTPPSSDSSPKPSSSSSEVADEWGEKSEPEPESSYTKLSESDPPKDEDEWGGDEPGVKDLGNGSASAAVVEDDKYGDLKRALVDTFYGTELGFRASPEVRAEVLELVNQLESLNPTPVPTDAAALDGNWVLLYTAFSELLPLLATGSIPLLKIKKIGQAVDTKSLTIDNSVTLSSPFADFSFTASANFEVQGPSRIQVQFKEGILNPPKISSSFALPPNVDIFGQKIDLSTVQNSLNPLQEGVANIARALSGQPPLKVPIPGERSSSFLIITYLDDDFRISRGDGGLFILAKEGSSLLDQ